MAALTTKVSPLHRICPQCCNCNQVGHLQCNCHRQHCLFCAKLGHLSKYCWYQQDTFEGQQISLNTKSPISASYINIILTVTAVKSTATVIKGKLGGTVVKIMLYSGSSVSLIQIHTIEGASNVVQVMPASNSIR